MIEKNDHGIGVFVSGKVKKVFSFAERHDVRTSPMKDFVGEQKWFDW